MHNARWFPKVLQRVLRSSRGITLVELMIALLLFGVGVMALAQSMPEGLATRDRARRMSVAASLAQETVERLRDLPFLDVDLAGGLHTDPDNPIRGAYQRSWTVQNDTPTTNMKRVTVTVTFVTSSPDSAATFTTLIAR